MVRAQATLRTRNPQVLNKKLGSSYYLSPYSNSVWFRGIMIAVTLLLERLTLPSPSLQSAYIVAHEYGSSETEAKVKRGRSEGEARIIRFLELYLL